MSDELERIDGTEPSFSPATEEGTEGAYVPMIPLEEVEEALPRRRRSFAVEETPKKKKKASAVAPFVEFAEVIVGALVAAILVLTLICRTGVVEGESMAPTMHGGDRYIISDLFYTPAQGDIVVFRPQIDGKEELWIKRVIAVAGQQVYINPDDNKVYVDGEPVKEDYLPLYSGTIPHSTPNPIVVPENHVYVLGDNRAVSHDSRYGDLGCVEINKLAGRVLFRFWPFEKFEFYN